MVDQWHDPHFALQWDQTSLAGNPTRVEQLDILLSLIADLYIEGTTIIDLGIGSGLVEEQLFIHRPDASIIGIESSQPMIDLARSRLSPFERQLRIIHHDLNDLTHFQDVLSSAENCSLMFSVQVFHHLPHHVQQALFKAIFDALTINGVFLLLDRVDLDPENFSDLYQAMWKRLEQVSQIKSGWSGDDFLQRLEKKEDHPARLENHLLWLREAGFAATCLHLHLNRALLVGVKK